MELAIVLLILVVASGFLYYGWIRLRQEAEAKARQLIFRKSHREGRRRRRALTPRDATVGVGAGTPRRRVGGDRRS